MPPDPASLPPQPGDHLVFLTGPKKGHPIRVDDLELGGPQAQAYPADPSGVVRDGTRFNLVIVVRIGSDGLSEETRGKVGRRRGRLFRRVHPPGLSR